MDVPYLLSILCRSAISGESGVNPEQSGYCDGAAIAKLLPKSEYLLLTLLFFNSHPQEEKWKEN